MKFDNLESLLDCFMEKKNQEYKSPDTLYFRNML